jgi:hypothetical protein
MRGLLAAAAAAPLVAGLDGVLLVLGVAPCVGAAPGVEVGGAPNDVAPGLGAADPDGLAEARRPTISTWCPT